RGAARKFGFGTAREQNCTESSEAADTCSDAGAFCAASDGADTGSGCGCCGDGFRVLPFSTATDGFAFVVHRFGSAGVGAARVGLEVDGVAVRENQSVELHAKFAATFNATGTLRFGEFAAHVRADGNDNFVVLCDRKGSSEVDRVARLGSAGRDAVFENH